MKETDFNIETTRHFQLINHFDIKSVTPECTKEYIKIPIELPWTELEKDVHLAFDKFGWYGMVHRMYSDWTRSRIYGGIGLTYNPEYVFELPEHAQGLGQPRSINFNMDPHIWLDSLTKYDYDKHEGESVIRGLNTYNDPLGLRLPTEVTRFRSFPSIFDKLKRPIFQGRLAEIRAREYGHLANPKNQELNWHTDEKNEIVSRLLIPLCYSDDYYIEFKETGNRLYFEPGYAYHWDTYKIHRWAFDYHEAIENRTCMVLGWSPWLDFDGDSWSVNEYCNKMHPMDMILNGLVI